MRSVNFSEIAKAYHKLGYCVLPVCKGKKGHPAEKWKLWQDRLPPAEEVALWYEEHWTQSVCVLTGPFYGFYVIDCDTEEARIKIESLIPDSVVCICASTPRGGRHYYFQYPENIEIPTKAKFAPGFDLRGSGGLVMLPPSKGSKGGRYTFISGGLRDSLPETPPELLAFLSRSIKSGGEETPYINNINNSFINYNNIYNSANDEPNGQLFSKGRRDNDFFSLCLTLKRGGMAEGEALQVLNRVADTTPQDFDRAVLPEKVKNAWAYQENKHKNLASEIREWIESTSGDTKTTDLDRDLDISTKKDRGNRSKILRRLSDEGFIRRNSKQHGIFRRVEGDLEKMDIADYVPVADSELVLPLGLNTITNLKPRAMMIIAGVPNSGKTGIMLNIARQNMAAHTVHYFTSEMGKDELVDRIDRFGDPRKDWTAVNFYERCEKFEDVIFPDDINLIDYLEIHEDFYEVGKIINGMFRKLNKGIIICAIQKRKGSDYAVGGGGSIDKCRIAINLEPIGEGITGSRATVTKAKGRVHEAINPNGMKVEYILRDGCHLKPKNPAFDGSWHWLYSL